MKDIYQQITDSIIEKLQAGVTPWACPWDRSTVSVMPHNFKTKVDYTGINILQLWFSAMEKGYTSSAWLTFKQAKDLGGKVRRGEKATIGIFYKRVEKEETNKETGETEDKGYNLAKPFYVFNLDQIDGIEEEKTELGQEFEPIEAAEQLLINSGANIKHGGNGAFYQHTNDFINLPDKIRFKQAADYYATATHELTHWTGHKSRLDRDSKSRFGTPEYAFEELIAEIGSAFINAELGLEGDLQHESYIAHWLEALENDKKFIFKAASQASKAHQYLKQVLAGQVQNKGVEAA